MTEVLNKRQAGRGYVVRAYSEQDGVSLYVTNVDTGYINTNIKSAVLFLNAFDAELAIKKVNERKPKKKAKFLFYISKVYYSTVTRFENRYTLVPTKLTKPDRYDFINGI